MRCRGVSLPQRHDVPGELELAGKNSGMNRPRHHLAQLKPAPEKLVIGAVAHAGAPVNEWAVLPALVLAHPGNGIRARIICARGISAAASIDPATNKSKTNHWLRLKISQFPHFPDVASSYRVLKKGRHNRAALSKLPALPRINRRHAPSARRPCRSWSRRSARHAGLRALPAGAASGWQLRLRAWYRSERSWSLRWPRWEFWRL